MSRKHYLVYMHRNKVNDKVYIGYTNDLNRRIGFNGNGYKAYGRKQSHFWNAIHKYGWDKFETIVLAKDLTQEEAIALEIYYIHETGCRNDDVGYNIAMGGEGGIIYKEHPRGMLGKKQSTLQRNTSIHLMQEHRSNAIKRKLIRVRYPDGQITHFTSMSKCTQYMGFSRTFLRNRLKEQTPYRNHENITSKNGLLRYKGCLFTSKDIYR